MINISEILVAFVCSTVLMVAMFIFNLQNNKSKHTDERVFQIMLIVSLFANIFETISFILDGKIFFGNYYILYFLNTFCFALTVLVALLWCLFVDYKLYCNIKRFKKKFLYLSIPYFIFLICLIINLFVKGFIFNINNNIYSRGLLNNYVYVLVFFYYFYSVYTLYKAMKNGVVVKFFPIFSFIIPCMIGTIIQGLCYGLATGWLSVSIAYVFISFQIQKFNAYVDESSGLFNKKYLNYYIDKNLKNSRKEYYGILMDANDFKKINDTYGHTIGDHAIYNIGNILSSSILNNSVAIRYAGDEFIVIINGNKDKVNTIIDNIKTNIKLFNKITNEPFKLSLSFGVSKYNEETIEEFITKMDKEMYEDKNNYYKNNKKSR